MYSESPSLSLSLSHIYTHTYSLSLSIVGEVSVTGQLGEIRWEQRITCSIWPGSGAGARRKESTAMYRVVCQPGRAHGGSPISAFQQIHIFNPEALGVWNMSAREQVEEKV
ncbi:hypothetical protein ILYODFUR_002503 [Ilyodon furcidens]|uniref:Uncharacterized protein n=1 Tax=Ilyodon furcidens TaxID=33524 RepID=A0ABV0T8C9_9TELE